MKMSNPPNIELVEHCGNCYWNGIDKELQTQFGDCHHDFTMIECGKHHTQMHCWYKCGDYVRSNTFAILFKEQNDRDKPEE